MTLENYQIFQSFISFTRKFFDKILSNLCHSISGIKKKVSIDNEKFSSINSTLFNIYLLLVETIWVSLINCNVYTNRSVVNKSEQCFAISFTFILQTKKNIHSLRWFALHQSTVVSLRSSYHTILFYPLIL